MPGRKRIAVIGAGLGGLSVGGFLQRAGFDVKIYEQAPTFSRIGAGIILSANAMKAFRRLQVEDNLLRTGIKPRGYISRAWDTGATMYEILFDAASEERFGGAYLNIHRGDLHATLEQWSHRIRSPSIIVSLSSKRGALQCISFSRTASAGKPMW
jgi:6-hydroxynicotinate 3-monooxygenase